MIVPLSAGLYLFGIHYRIFLFAAAVVQSGYLLWRGITLERLPLVGVHDTVLFLAFSTAIFGVVVAGFVHKRATFLQTVAGLCFLLTIVGTLSRPVNTPLPPVLRTFWFELHVVLSFLSYALFGIGGLLGGLQLVGKLQGSEPVQYRVLLLGYLFFSVSMIFGGIWAYLAWGTYWLYTPKEIWTTLLWLFYTIYLHLRLIVRLRERLSSIMALLGYLVVIFTYLGVGLLMKSSHSF